MLGASSPTYGGLALLWHMYLCQLSYVLVISQERPDRAAQVGPDA